MEARNRNVPRVLVIILFAPMELAWIFLSCAVEAKASDVPNVLVIMLFAPIELA